MVTFDNDLVLVLGVVVMIFAIPAAISAFSDSRPPRAAAVAVLVGGGLVLLAVMSNPGGYSLGQLPDVFTRVVARVIGR